LNPFNPNRF